MFDLEKMEVTPEYDPYIKEVVRGHENEVQALLTDMDTHLGEGRTANVSVLHFKEEICIKMYKKPGQIKGVDFYLPVHKEKILLERLHKLGTKARVPEVFSSFEDDDQAGHDFLMMEKLVASSVDDILLGKAPLPENFDINSFEADLLEFVEKMHERGVYHRDLHEGNIMIDNNTAEVYIIDLGAGAEFDGQPEPGERGPYHVTKNGQTIKLASDEVTVKKVIAKMRARLTVNV